MSGFLAEHDRKDGVDAVEVAADVHVNHPVPVVDRAVLPEREQHQTGVVDQDVDPAEPIDSEVGQCLHVGGVSDIGEPGDGGAAGLVDVGDQLVEVLLAAGGSDDLGAAGGESLGADGADTGGGTGDDDDLVLKVVHGCLPVRWLGTLLSCQGLRRLTT